MKYAISLLSLLLLMGTTTQLTAQKYGYADSQKVIDQMPEVKRAQAQLKTLEEQLQKRGQKMLVDLQTRATNAQKKAQSGGMSPIQVKQEEEALQKEQLALAEYEQKMIAQLQTKQQQLMKPIKEKINNAFKAVAKEKGYAYIFDLSSGFLLYYDESLDLTDDIIAKLASM